MMVKEFDGSLTMLRLTALDVVGNFGLPEESTIAGRDLDFYSCTFMHVLFIHVLILAEVICDWFSYTSPWGDHVGHSSSLSC